MSKPFEAGRHGRCKGCGYLYRPGERIRSAGKGLGAYHVECFGSTTDQARSDHLRVVQERTRTSNEVAKWTNAVKQQTAFPPGTRVRKLKPRKKPPLAR